MSKKQKKKFGYKNLWKTITFYKKHKGIFFFGVLSIIIYTLVGFVEPIISGNTMAFLAETKFDKAIQFALILIGVLLIKETSKMFVNMTYSKLNTKVVFDLKHKLIDSITTTTMSEIDKTNSGVFIERLHEDTRRCSDVILEILRVSLGVLSNIGFLIYIAFLNIWCFIILLAYVIVLWLWDSLREKKWFTQRKQFRKKSEIATGAYNEQVRGLRDVKSLNIRQNSIKSANDRNEDALQINLKSRLTRHKISWAKNITSCFFEVGFILLGILFIKLDFLSLAEFLIIYMYHENVFRLASDISFFKEYSTEGELSAERIFDIIDNFKKEEFGDKELKNIIGNVNIKNVTFAYDKEIIINNVSINFEANKTTAIVGKSGSGKSTILSLINRLYSIKNGEILIDNINTKELTEDSLRENVGLITQSPYIFNTTIRENLLLVKPKAKEKELIEVLKKAQIWDFVDGLEKGLDSVVGENGVMLSGGQKQRIALARLLLKNPPIIMLDEATSALDNESQGKIVEAIDNIKNEHTVIVVAHRLSTIQNADKIIVIDGGKVIAEGKHAMLYKQCKIYNELYKNEQL